MSGENVELVRRMAAAFNQGSVEDLRPFMDAGLEYHEDPSFPEAGVYRGREAWEAYARQFLAQFSEIRYEVGETIESGDKVLANLHIEGRGSASGAEFQLSAWWGMEIRDGPRGPVLRLPRPRQGCRSPRAPAAALRRRTSLSSTL